MGASTAYDPTMPATTRLTRHDLPAVCLLISAWAALGGGAFAVVGWSSKPPTIDQLASIQGRVVDAYLKRGSGKGRPQVHVLVEASDGVHDLSRDNMSPAISRVLTVQKNDAVAALVQSGSIAQPTDILWELRRGNTAILRYQDVADQVASENRRATKTAMWFGSLGALFFIAAVTLRVRFGAWRERRPSTH